MVLGIIEQLLLGILILIGFPVAFLGMFLLGMPLIWVISKVVDMTMGIWTTFGRGIDRWIEFWERK